MLQRVDRRTVLADQEPEVVAVYDRADLLIVLSHLDGRLQLERLRHVLEQFAYSLGRTLRHPRLLCHSRPRLPSASAAGALLTLSRGLRRRSLRRRRPGGAVARAWCGRLPVGGLRALLLPIALGILRRRRECPHDLPPRAGRFAA